MTREITITGNDQDQRIDRFLRKRFPQIPLSMIFKVLRQKKVRVFRGTEKFHAKKGDSLAKGDLLKLYFDVDAFGEAPQQHKPDYDFLLKSKFYRQNFQVLYEDEYLWIVDKPAGIAVHPGSKTPWGKSLIDLFIATVKQENPETPDPKLAHRLDKGTSGLVLISKNDATLRKLTAMLRDGEVGKYYLALVKGKLKKQKGEINADLLRTEGSKYTKIQVSRKAAAKSSRTLYEVQQYFPQLNATLVEVELDTGRMHQIRVHFASEGHPLAGDDAYGDHDWNKELKKKYKLARQFLHAYRLTFRHPETGKKVGVKSPLPSDLQLLVETG